MEEQYTREELESLLQEWMDGFENDHYVYDIYGEEVTVGLDRKTIEELWKISIVAVEGGFQPRIIPDLPPRYPLTAAPPFQSPPPRAPLPPS